MTGADAAVVSVTVEVRAGVVLAGIVPLLPGKVVPAAVTFCSGAEPATDGATRAESPL